MKCPACGTEALPGARFCGNCGADLGRSVCPRCNSPVAPAAMFCPNCGNSLAAVATDGGEKEPPPEVAPASASAQGEARTQNAPPAPNPSPPPEPRQNRRRRRGCGCLGKGCLIPLVLLLVIIGGAYLWMVSPDLPPRPWEIVGGRLSSFVSANLGGRVPFSAADRPLPNLEPALEKQVNEAVAKDMQEKLAPKPGSIEERQAQIRSQLTAARLPYTEAYILETEAGEPVLAVGLRYKDISGINPISPGLSEGIDAFLKLAENKNLSLAGLQHLAVGVEDDQGRVLFSVAAPVSAIESYRAGKIARPELIRSIGFKGVSRMGIIETLGKAVTQQ